MKKIDFPVRYVNQMVYEELEVVNAMKDIRTSTPFTIIYQFLPFRIIARGIKSHVKKKGFMIGLDWACRKKLTETLQDLLS